MGVDDKALREQALRLASSYILNAKPKPIRTAEQIAPIVYTMLRNEVPVEIIDKVLRRTKAHTPNAMQMALSDLHLLADGQRFPTEPIRPIEERAPWDGPTPGGRELIAQARSYLHP